MKKIIKGENNFIGPDNIKKITSHFEEKLIKLVTNKSFDKCNMEQKQEISKELKSTIENIDFAIKFILSGIKISNNRKNEYHALDVKQIHH